MLRFSRSVAMVLFTWSSIVGADGSIEYNRDIRPIFSDTCFQCHGPDSAARKADLRMDVRDAAIETGAITPGKPDESEAIRRIFSTDPDEMMPPPASHKVLTDEQKNRLREWVLAGAEYQPHWSLIAPSRPEIPVVENPDWVRNPIDAFILERLEKEGLEPAPEADKRTLARRVSLDTTGLPPSPEDVEAFVNDPSPNAYEAYLDRMLNTTEWGEHRGRYWLDYARYADTHGIHFDNYREMWAYRDWVIRAFAQNMPFDQFTIENLAGDLLPNRTLDQWVASGFNRCNITTNEGGAIAEEYLTLYTRDRTETTSQVWLGLTANCAVCHDHKFDPLSQQEFYQMAAFFNNTTQAAMDGNIKDTPPTIVVPMPADRERFQQLGPEIEQAAKQIEDRRTSGRKDFEQWLTSASRESVTERIPTEGIALHLPLDDGAEKSLKATVDGQPASIEATSKVTWEAGHVANQALKCQSDSVVAIPEAGNFERDQAFSCGAWVKLPGAGTGGSVLARMDEASLHRGWDLWLENGKLGAHIIHQWPADAFKVVSKQPIDEKSWHHLFMTYDGSGKIEGIKIYVDGIPQPVDISANTLTKSIKTAVPLKVGQRNISARVTGAFIQDVRVYNRALAQEEVVDLAGFTRAAHLVTKAPADRSAEETEELFHGWLKSVDTNYKDLLARSAQLQREKSEIEARGTVAHVMAEKNEEAMAYVLYRGEYDKPRDPVKPETPQMLPPMPTDLPRNRLGFAQWLLRPEHPLTARVTVNRSWQEVFGSGIVLTSGDFGITGELPSHPELLDWLAVEFRESGWNVKRLFKLMLMSSTYRQSAQTTPEKLEADPQNRLLARGPRFRMDAEMVRDAALAASGTLVRKHGGPSVKPYQPPGVWEAVAMIGSNTREYKQDSGENLYRRSMYTLWKRSAPPASMEIFNAPNRETCTVRRERTNTPLQALVTLNDPQFVEAARVLAERTLQDAAASDDERFDSMGRRLISRTFREPEKLVLRQSIQELSEHYLANPEEAKALIAFGESKPSPSFDPGVLAAWTMLANELMNLDEFLNK